MQPEPADGFRLFVDHEDTDVRDRIARRRFGVPWDRDRITNRIFIMVHALNGDEEEHNAAGGTPKITRYDLLGLLDALDHPDHAVASRALSEAHDAMIARRRHE